MDNNAFETKMFETVNKNAKTKREATKKKKTNKARAIVEMICWMLCFVVVAYSVYVFCMLGYLPTGLAIVTTSCISYVAGIRVGGLIKWI
jgi:uncharacterized membrane protein